MYKQNIIPQKEIKIDVDELDKRIAKYLYYSKDINEFK